jgi:hypothetical protein
MADDTVTLAVNILQMKMFGKELWHSLLDDVTLSK